MTKGYIIRNSENIEMRTEHLEKVSFRYNKTNKRKEKDEENVYFD